MPGFPGVAVEEPPAPTPVVRETIDWIAPNGATYRFVIEPGPQGRFMVPIDLATEKAVGRSGSRVRQLRHGERGVMFPIYLAGTDATSLRSDVRALCRLLDPAAGIGTLRNTTISGEVRDLSCYYTGGLEGDEAIEQVGPTWFRAVPSFLAPDPYWYDTVGVGYSWKANDPPAFFNPGFPPMELGESSVLGLQTVVNDGDVDTWPIWTARGPFTQVLIYNRTTGKSMTINATVDASGWVQVDTRPGFKKVIDHTAENRYAAVASTQGSTLFPLGAGENVIDITITGATGGVTQLELLLFRRYLTP